VHEGSFRFAGVDDHYFIAATVNPGPARIEYRSVMLPATTSPNTERQLLAQTYHFTQPPSNIKFYFGPKSFDVLKSVDAEFVRAIHYGIFAWLAVPLLGALKWIFGFTHNYGWAIILLTILINIVIFPLRHKSVVSMRKMQALQPQLKAIQDRYTDLKVTDPARQKMNTEVMNLYREKGVNPASGCIPMLLTLPVLFAFYSLLQQSIELRGAPFALWIHDLSHPDPYFVTPLLMGASMFWQQKITPSTADPTQQRVMMIMPLMLSVMFLWAPSGLVLYWFVSNLWAIGQQYFTNWLIGPPVVQAARPPAERKLKNAGAGRTERAEKRS
jgi:YidC/Oxa1 family membrane protein insertase